jgi:hypothetical protein
MNRLLAFLVIAFALTSNVLCASGRLDKVGKPSKVSAKYLKDHIDAYYGKRLSVHGCVEMPIEGFFIEPCGSKNWRDIILLDLSGADDSIWRVIRKARKPWFEADIVGRLTKETFNNRGGPRTVDVLVPESISHVVAHEP